MIAHRTLRQEQLRGDLPIILALCHQLRNGQFSLGEPIEDIVHSVTSTCSRIRILSMVVCAHLPAHARPHLQVLLSGIVERKTQARPFGSLTDIANGQERTHCTPNQAGEKSRISEARGHSEDEQGHHKEHAHPQRTLMQPDIDDHGQEGIDARKECSCTKSADETDACNLAMRAVQTLLGVFPSAYQDDARQEAQHLICQISHDASENTAEQHETDLIDYPFHERNDNTQPSHWCCMEINSEQASFNFMTIVMLVFGTEEHQSEQQREPISFGRIHEHDRVG